MIDRKPAEAFPSWQRWKGTVEGDQTLTASFLVLSSPTLCSSSQGASDDFIDANIQLALRLAQQLKESKGHTSKLVSATAGASVDGQSGAQCTALHKYAVIAQLRSLSICSLFVNCVWCCAALAGPTRSSGGATGSQEVSWCPGAGEESPPTNASDPQSLVHG